MADKLKWLDALLADKDLSTTAKLVAVRLFRHHNDESGQCDPNQDTIAAGIGRSLRAVSRAITELREAGWIEVHLRRERADYVLVIDRAGAGVERELRQKRRARYDKSGVPGTPEMAHEVRQKWRTEPPKETIKETTHPTRVPAGAASEPVAPAIAPEMLEPILPMPANANRPEGDGEVFSGWTIPGETMRQWVATFTDLNVRDELMRRARWYVANVPEERRLRVFEGKLREFNEKARQARLDRKDAKAADVEAGVRRDDYGRSVAIAGWIENPRARPPGADRYWMPPSPGREKVFAGSGFFVTQGDFDVLTGRHPNLDLRAGISAYERDHGTVERGHDDHIAGLVAYLAALPEAQAA